MDSRPGKYLNTNRSLKVLEINKKNILLMALFKKLSYMCCQRQRNGTNDWGGDGVARKNLCIIFALSMCGVLKSNLNERSQFTFDFAIMRTMCKVSTSYIACIIIRRVDILIIFFSKHILPIPNHINLNNYYSFCI